MGLKHQAVSARKWRAAHRRVETHIPSHLPPLVFLTDPERTPEPIAIAERLPIGTGILYRHFGAEDRWNVAPRLAGLARQRGFTFLIAADPLLALEVGAHGVHWPEARLRDALKWRGRFRLQTASAHSRSAIVRAERMGLDAALVSTVFPSKSPSAGQPMGSLRLRRLAQTGRLPLYALGGIDAENSAQVSDVAGLSAISSFTALKSDDRVHSQVQS